MSLILSIETATTVCSVALHDKGCRKATSTFYLDQSHSSILMPTIRALLESCGTDPHQLSAIAVSEGPGSYTGLRIGTSTVKGLCFALDKPLVAVNTLHALAHQVADYYHDGYILCPMIDARRMEVYTCLTTSLMTVVEEVHPKIIDQESFANELSEHKLVFFGNGASKCKPIIKHPNAIFIDNIEPSAEHIGYLAYERFESGLFEELAYFEPRYLKEFRATVPKAKI